MRRTIAITLAAAATLGLTACGSSTADLSQDKAKSALLEAAELPDGGWTAGEVVDKKPGKSSSDPDQMFKGAQGMSQACKDALKSMTDLATSDATAYAKRSYTKGTDKDKGQVEVVVETTTKAKEVPPAMAKVAAECKTITMAGGTGGADAKIVMESPALKTADGKALQMGMTLMGQSMGMVMAGVAKGNNLVIVQSSGKEVGKIKDLVDSTLGKQADKVTKTAG